MTRIWLREYNESESKSTWKLRLFDMLDTDKISPNRCIANDDVIVVWFISPLNDGQISDSSNAFLSEFTKHSNSILLSVNEDYSYNNASFHINDVLMGYSCKQNYLEFGHPYTYCGDKPKSITNIESNLIKKGFKVFSSISDCSNYLNEVLRRD